MSLNSRADGRSSARARPSPGFFAVLTSAFGTNLPIRNVRFHGETWRISGRATAIAKATFMTQSGCRRSKLFALRDSLFDHVMGARAQREWKGVERIGRTLRQVQK